MSYYDTIDDDIVRAKEILLRGKAEPLNLPMPEHIHFGGTIFGADVYAAYKLLGSFVAEIERLLALEIAYHNLCDHMNAEKRCDFPEHLELMVDLAAARAEIAATERALSREQERRALGHD